MKQEEEMLALEHAEMNSLQRIENQEGQVLQQLDGQTASLRTIEEKEQESSQEGQPSQKSPTKEGGGALEEQKVNEAKKDDAINSTARSRTAVEEAQAMKETKEALLNVSQHLQGEVRETLKHIEQNLELHVSNSTSLLSQFQAQKPAEDLSGVQRNLSSGFVPAPMCCRPQAV